MENRELIDGVDSLIEAMNNRPYQWFELCQIRGWRPFYLHRGMYGAQLKYVSDICEAAVEQGLIEVGHDLGGVPSYRRRFGNPEEE